MNSWAGPDMNGGVKGDLLWVGLHPFCARDNDFTMTIFLILFDFLKFYFKISFLRPKIGT